MEIIRSSRFWRSHPDNLLDSECKYCPLLVGFDNWSWNWKADVLPKYLGVGSASRTIRSSLPFKCRIVHESISASKEVHLICVFVPLCPTTRPIDTGISPAFLEISGLIVISLLTIECASLAWRSFKSFSPRMLSLWLSLCTFVHSLLISLRSYDFTTITGIVRVLQSCTFNTPNHHFKSIVQFPRSALNTA
jgi:hypothetical protein